MFSFFRMMFLCCPLVVLAQRMPDVKVDSLVTDTLFDSAQRIYRISISWEELSEASLQWSLDTIQLCETSALARSKGALAAINGSFFSVRNHHMVTYFEQNDSVIRPSLPDTLSTLFTGVIIDPLEGRLKIEPRDRDSVYQRSKAERWVMSSGPLLLLNGEKQLLPQGAFSSRRHPRSCLAYNAEELWLITADGRQEKAGGLSLYELQDLLLWMGATDAINLDGGGSSTLWTKANGVINTPSDPEGERPVANALLLIPTSIQIETD